jgi:hypothetical protein
MNTAFKTSGTISAIALAAGLMLHASAIAGDAASPSGPVIKPALPASSITNEVLQNSTLATAPCCSSLAKGLNLVFTQYLSCSNAAGCEYENDDMIQVGADASGLANNRWAICAQIDGLPLDPPCPYAGHVPKGTSYYETRNSIQTLHAGPGSHKLQVYVFIEGAASLGNGTSVWRQYVP